MVEVSSVYEKTAKITLKSIRRTEECLLDADAVAHGPEVLGQVPLPGHDQLGELVQERRAALVGRRGAEERAAPPGQHLEVLAVVEEGHQAEEALEQVPAQVLEHRLARAPVHEPGARGPVAPADVRVGQDALRDDAAEGAERGEAHELPVAARGVAGLVNLHAADDLEAELQPGELVALEQLQEGLPEAQVCVGLGLG